MNICCDKFKEFADDGEVITATESGRVFLTQFIESDDDGDGHIDDTIGLFEPINFCPFCGKKFTIQRRLKEAPNVTTPDS